MGKNSRESILRSQATGKLHYSDIPAEQRKHLPKAITLREINSRNADKGRLRDSPPLTIPHRQKSAGTAVNDSRILTQNQLTFPMRKFEVFQSAHAQ